jgi:hypothetical protein
MCERGCRKRKDGVTDRWERARRRGRRTKNKSGAHVGCASKVRDFTALDVANTTRTTMAKRKSIVDPEELPDAADKGKQHDDDDSGSDEVCDTIVSPQCA